MPAPISDGVFSDFLACRRKAYLRLCGQSEQTVDYVQLQSDLHQAYCPRAAKHLFRSQAGSTIIQNPASLSRAIEQGQAIIVDAVGTANGLLCRFDALIRNTWGNSSASPEYVPVLCLPGDRVSRHDKLRLAFSALVIGALQTKEIPCGNIVHGPTYSTAKIKLVSLLTTAQHTILDIQDIRDGRVVPPLRLNDHCSVCGFKDHCYEEASCKDDISLLRGLSEKEIDRLNSKGIFTVTQYSYTFRLRKKAVKAEAGGRKHDHALQALAIRTNRIYVTQTPQIPSSRLELYLDVETVPQRNECYLIGVLLCDGETQEYHPFWADDSTAELGIWKSFLAFIEELGDFTLFHYGAFDLQVLRRLEKTYGGDVSLFEKLCTASYNVLGAIYSQVYFPTYSNGLKYVASHLGFTWTNERASGVQAIVWRHRWEATKDDNIRHILVTYNRDDCLALRTVTEEIRRITAEGASAYSISEHDVPAGPPVHFGKQTFFFPELDRVNKCAYFDYQRSRVYARTSSAVKKSVRRKAHNKPTNLRVNKEVFVGQPDRCLQCAATDFERRGRHSKTVFDLRLTPSGILRSVVRYRTRTYRCRGCNTDVVPAEYCISTASKYGHVLRAWAVNQLITLRSSGSRIAEHVRDLFGYPLDAQAVRYCKRMLAAYYKDTFDALVKTIRHGNLVHADEAKATVKGKAGYVWVFTSLEEVIYIYSDSREGSVAKEVLKDFHGVLVSDFYAVYDAIDCVQQKCLIHLIRDLNDDLFKNPFDEEFKLLGKAFTGVIVPIIETIDHYGLKKHHLGKHKAAVRMFFETVLAQKYRSAVARGYQERLAKYHDKLFCFLDYDGVPWNNNNAEQAVKRFVNLMAVIGGSSTPDSMQEYLVLLSISETLRRKGLSFLRFLVSGDKDIGMYVGRQGRRGREK